MERKVEHMAGSIEGLRVIPDTRRSIRIAFFAVAIGAILPGVASAGVLSWLDDVVQASVRKADPEIAARRTGRLFARESAEIGEDGLGVIVRRGEDLGRGVRRADDPAGSLLDARFDRLIDGDVDLAREFGRLSPAERKFVVEMGETAQNLAKKYPGRADAMIRGMGADGLSAVAVYGDDVAEVLAAEGPQAVNVLRRSGRTGWKFFTETVIPNKNKLAAAGVLTAFLAAPEQFVDMAGQATDFAVRQFATAGIQLASAVGGGAVRGLETAVGSWLETQGLNFSVIRYVGMVAAAWAVIVSGMVIIGLPARIAKAPFALALWPVKRIVRLIRG